MAPCVRTCETRCAGVVVGGLVRVDLPLVWENAVEGEKRSVMNKVMAMRFKGVSPSTLLGSKPFVARLYQRPRRLLE